MEELQLEIIMLFWLMGINGAPILLTKLLGQRFSYPIDCNRLFFDGRPILGSSKTFRGLVSALLVSVLIGSIFAACSMGSGRESRKIDVYCKLCQDHSV